MRPNPTPWLALCVLCTGTLAGCADTARLSAQQWQVDQCRRLPDLAERQRCEQSNARSFEEFERENAKRQR